MGGHFATRILDEDGEWINHMAIQTLAPAPLKEGVSKDEAEGLAQVFGKKVCWT